MLRLICVFTDVPDQSGQTQSGQNILRLMQESIAISDNCIKFFKHLKG